MRLHHRGVTIELPDDDRRVLLIETLIFGGPLPPPEPMPQMPDMLGEQGAFVRTASREVLLGWRHAWRALSPDARRWLVRLSKGAVPSGDLSRELSRGRGRTPSSLSGLHLQIRHVCDGTGVKWPIVSRGRAQQRRWSLTPEAADFVRFLDENEESTPSEKD